MSTSEAAHRLGVTTRQVRNLAAHGELTLVARGVLDATSVDRYAAIDRTGTQAWSEATAWAAVAILSGVDPVWLGPTQRSRLRARLRTISAARLVDRTRSRATVTRCSAHPSAFPRIANDLVEPATATLGLAASTRSELDGYATASDVAALRSAHQLVDDVDGRVTLRATGMDMDIVRALAEQPVLGALDLSASLDPRARRAGLDALRRALDEVSHGA